MKTKPIYLTPFLPIALLVAVCLYTGSWAGNTQHTAEAKETLSQSFNSVEEALENGYECVAVSNAGTCVTAYPKTECLTKAEWDEVMPIAMRIPTKEDLEEFDIKYEKIMASNRELIKLLNK